MTRENPLWDLIQAYMDSPHHRYPPKPADLARDTGISEQVLSKWKKAPTLPTTQQLNALARGTRIPYPAILDAALRGRGYLPHDWTLTLLDERQSGEDPDASRRRRAVGIAHRSFVRENVTMSDAFSIERSDETQWAAYEESHTIEDEQLGDDTP